MIFKNSCADCSGIKRSPPLSIRNGQRLKWPSKFAAYGRVRVGVKKTWPKKWAAANRRYRPSNRPATSATRSRFYAVSRKFSTLTWSSRLFREKRHNPTLRFADREIQRQITPSKEMDGLKLSETESKKTDAHSESVASCAIRLRFYREAAREPIDSRLKCRRNDKKRRDTKV